MDQHGEQQDSPLGTTTVIQVGIVVEDIDAKVQAWAALLGCPPPSIIITDEWDRARTEYGGEPSQARAKLAFFNLGQVVLELIEPLGEPSTWRDQLNAHGASLHHIAFEVDDMGARVAALAALGIPMLQRGEYEGGRYAYLDGTSQLGAVLELLEND